MDLENLGHALHPTVNRSNMSEWIDVKDKDIPFEKWVLFKVIPNEDYPFSYFDPSVFVGKIDDREDVCSAYGDGWTPYSKKHITHWMEIPPDP